MKEKFRTKNPVSKDNIKPFKALPGVFRQTLSYNEETMLCFFRFEKGSEIPLHNHENVQIGYVIKGKVKFLSEILEHEFVAKAGDSYVFDKNEPHGATLLEDTELIEVFYPYRPEYEPRD